MPSSAKMAAHTIADGEYDVEIAETLLAQLLGMATSSTNSTPAAGRRPNTRHSDEILSLQREYTRLGGVIT
jgi:hypothetical protein